MDLTGRASDVAAALVTGRTALGIELGSTRIKACLIGPDHLPIASGGSSWENQLVDGIWSYSLDAVWAGLREAFADLAAQVEQRYQLPLSTVGAIGISAMMHGYLAFDAAGELLVPFRTWRNTNTGPAAAELSEVFGFNVPLRWSIAHLYQAVLNGEPHVPEIAHLTTLAGYVHWRLTGRRALGVGDASGIFPIDPQTNSYDLGMVKAFDELVADRQPGLRIADLLPQVLVAGQEAGRLSAEGAELLDPSGMLAMGAVLCPPEGDAGTGMVATNAVAPRTGNVSAGTSIFAMVVLDRPLAGVYPELDVVSTPAGDPVAMVHCNNGASELGTWAAVFGEFATAIGAAVGPDEVFAALVGSALQADPDGGGLLAYNYLSGEPITGLEQGRPLLARTPESRLSLGNFARTQLYSVFATLALGIRVLDGEGVDVEVLSAHGGLFRTAGVAQRLLAAAMGAPVAVATTASEGGAWGAALLAAFVGEASGHDLTTYLRELVFADAAMAVVEPDPVDLAGFAAYLERYTSGLPLERAATQSLRSAGESIAEITAPQQANAVPAGMRAEVDAARARVAELHAELPRWGLAVWTAGNVSERVRNPQLPDGAGDLLVIKPSGVGYDELCPEAMVVCDLDGVLVEGQHAPSSDTAAHAYVYRHMPEVGGVVHTHSTYATAWAARGEEIPCALTMMADEFGGPIPVGPFAVIGDDSIGRGIVETLRGHRSRAVLMRSHGPFTIGRDARAAVKAAVMCEEVARTIHITRQLGQPLPIEPGDIDSLHNRYQNVYGQR